MNNYYPYTGQPMYGNQMGMAYNMQPPKKVVCNNPLTKDQLALLQQKGDKLQLSLTDVEVAKAICTHKKDGRIMLMKNDPTNPNKVTCAICGETFELTEGDNATIEQVCDLMKNVFQTLKTYWLDVPNEVAQNLYTVLPLIEKLPKVYNLAVKSFSQVEQYNNMSEANQPFGFAMFNNLMNPQMAMGMGGMYPQQPMMPQMNTQNMAFPNPIGQPAGYVPQPGYAPNPVAMPQMNGYGAPMYTQDPNANPFGYNGPAVPAQQPAAPAQQSAPEAPAAAPATSVNDKVFSV